MKVVQIYTGCMNVVKTILQLLSFRLSREQMLEFDRRHSAAALAGTWVVGMGRYWDVHQSYHGNTQGALSIMGNEYWRRAFRPLIPGNQLLHFNNQESINRITDATAAVIMDPVQAEAGVVLPAAGFLQQIRKRCNDTGTLLIFDEIQTGMGRTGSLFCFEQYGVVPDILLLAKALGGGMPLGAFIASEAHMHQLTFHPVLGHLTTFGGHPVSCAAGKAAMEVVLNDGLVNGISYRQNLFRQQLQHVSIKEFRSVGLLMAGVQPSGGRVGRGGRVRRGRRAGDACTQGGSGHGVGGCGPGVAL